MLVSSPLPKDSHLAGWGGGGGKGVGREELDIMLSKSSQMIPAYIQEWEPAGFWPRIESTLW